MKNLFIFCFLLSQTIVFASADITAFINFNKDFFDSRVIKDRVVIQLATELSAEEKNIFFEKFSFLMPYHPNMEIGRNRVIAVRFNKNISNYAQLKMLMNELSAADEIAMVNPVVKNAKEMPVLILNPVFFSLNKNVSLETAMVFLKNIGIEEVKQTHFSKSIYQFSLPKNFAFNNLEIAAYLNQQNLFAFAEPNYGFYIDACTIDDPLFPRQWHLLNEGTALQGSGTAGADIKALDAWNITTGSPDIKIAIIDSGTDTLHSDLVDNMLPGFDATGGGSFGFPNTNLRNDAHGTACAGIAAAKGNNAIGIAGVAYDCKIIPVKVFFYVDTSLGGGPSQILPYSEAQWMADAITWSWQTGEADIMSNSWGLPPLFLALLPGNPAIVDTAIQQAHSLGRNGWGTAMFFSSGNEGFDPIWPSSLPQTIAVNATSMCDERKSPTSCDGESWEGNWGNNLDISAPGVRIPSTDITGPKGYTAGASGNFVNTFNGTSAACPIAAAVGALVLSVRPELTAEEVRFILGTSADRIGGYNYSTNAFAGTWSRETGYGRVNAYQAVLEALGLASVKQNEAESQVKIFPNPLQGNELQIDWSETLRITNIEVVTLSGQKLGNVEWHSNGAVFFRNEPESGVYFVRIFSEKNMLVKKLIVF